jgi:hypothetical protein
MDDLPIQPFSLVNLIETFILADVMVHHSQRLVLRQEIVEPALRPRGPTLTGGPTMARRRSGLPPAPDQLYWQAGEMPSKGETFDLYRSICEANCRVSRCRLACGERKLNLDLGVNISS